jgi:hypothetical protein
VFSEHSFVEVDIVTFSSDTVGGDEGLALPLLVDLLAVFGFERREVGIGDPCAAVMLAGSGHITHYPRSITYNSFVYRNMTGKVRSLTFLPPSA